MGYLLTQSSSALVVKAREAGENRAYSLYMLTRLRLDPRDGAIIFGDVLFVCVPPAHR
jgi:hypothetical protein